MTHSHVNRLVSCCGCAGRGTLETVCSAYMLTDCRPGFPQHVQHCYVCFLCKSSPWVLAPCSICTTASTVWICFHSMVGVYPCVCVSILSGRLPDCMPVFHIMRWTNRASLLHQWVCSRMIMLTHVQECHMTNTHLHNVRTCWHICTHTLYYVLYKNTLDTVRLKLEWYLCIYIYIVRVFSQIVCYKQMQALF